jgi:hypothetical protein
VAVKVFPMQPGGNIKAGTTLILCAKVEKKSLRLWLVLVGADLLLGAASDPATESECGIQRGNAGDGD